MTTKIKVEVPEHVSEVSVYRIEAGMSKLIDIMKSGEQREFHIWIGASIHVVETAPS